MADNPLGIGGRSSPGGVDILKEVLGMGSARGTSSVGASGTGASSGRGGMFGARGQRMLPADYPADQMDRNAARGTYLDILV